ncbi:DUF2505 domain-containing protein [Corynebacterium terpenotabidum]|uniref:DUF2505 domain-containing protein n=1 Tax=Corynebacterium terpenotabidum Y-11 TaxID=1200352 RepID=S4XIU8_9CORY|nr:DUF2505 domain-containing protein [Corynebacterium terpenotabidum]AGP31680.1 hypothetical protein A606_10205 [Corynebacterium terpenotabidum Y-11]
MTTHIETSATINAPIETVYATLSDRAYWEYDAANLSDDPGEVSEFSTEDGVNVTLFEVLAANALPEAVRSMVSQNLKLKRVVHFGELSDGVSNGEMSAEIKGTPVKFTAELTLVEEDGATTLEAEADVNVMIPMIGAVIEPKVADAVKDILVNESALVEKWIAEHA